MKGLLLRLSAVDAGAEAAVRVIAYFDELVAHRAGLAELVRAAAALAECVAGLRTGDGPALRYRPDGRRAAEPEASPSGSAELPGGRVWLERLDAPGPLDDVVLERFAIAAGLLGAPPEPHLADPALVELVLGERAGAEDRVRALRLLGLDPAGEARVVAVHVPGERSTLRGGLRAIPGAPGPRTIAADLVAFAGPPRVAVVDGVAAAVLQPRAGAVAMLAGLRASLALLTGTDGHRLGVRVGIGRAGTATDARRSWQEAMVAQRFSAPGALTDHAELGSLALLAELSPAQLRAQPDVTALHALAPADLAALEAFCHTGSLRQAATALHLHHSSVAARLAHVEQALGWRLDGPQHRFRAQFALLARRLAANSAELDA